MRVARLIVFGVALASIGGAGCKTAEPVATESPKQAQQAANVSVQFYVGDKASGSCAGVLVGPRAVLTAAHCATGKTSAIVHAPNAGNRKVTANAALWFDWQEGASPKTSKQRHDLTVIQLDSPITLKKYPKIAEETPRATDRALYVHRVKAAGSKKVSFVTEVAGKATPAKSKGFPHAYAIVAKKTAKLDPGAPVYNARTGEIVGVVSGRGTKSHTLYVSKSKALIKWLHDQLLATLLSKKDAPTSTDGAPTTDQDDGTGSSGTATTGGTSTKKPSKAKKTPMGKKTGAKKKGGSSSSGSSSGGAKDDAGAGEDDQEKDPLDDELCEAGDNSCNEQCEDDGCSCDEGDCEDDDIDDDDDDLDTDDDDDDTEDDDDDDDDFDDDFDDQDDVDDDGEDDGEYDNSGDDYGDEGGDYGGDEGGGDEGGGDYGGDEGGGDYGGGEE